MNLDHFALSHICDNCPERVKTTPSIKQKFRVQVQICAHSLLVPRPPSLFVTASDKGKYYLLEYSFWILESHTRMCRVRPGWAGLGQGQGQGRPDHALALP